MFTLGRANTLNICLGHVPFPEQFSEYVDVMLSPRVVASKQLAVIDDSYFGESGSALSEYVQLLWLYDHFDAIVGNCAFVRILQYRRFVSHSKIGKQSNLDYIRWIKRDELGRHEKEFSRFSTGELFNQTHKFSHGMLMQYQEAHVLIDLINFSKFLLENGILDSNQVASFLSAPLLIPACNVGTFRTATLREILKTLRQAADFIKTSYFTPRTGYQRRSPGFLLERLNSHLILHRIQSGLSKANFGRHILISDGPLVTSTTELSAK